MNKYHIILSAPVVLLVLMHWQHILLERNQRQLIAAQVQEITVLEARIDQLQKFYATTNQPTASH